VAIDSTIFREYDIRGLVGKNMDAGVFELLGKGVGTYMQRLGSKRLAIGRDIRISSPEFAAAMIKGLRSTGCDVTDFGMVPTPVLNFGVIEYEYEGGVEITASHNPIDYNGCKFRTFDRSLFGPDIQEIKELIEAGDFATGEGSLDERDVNDAYMDKVVSLVDVKRPLKVVVDAGNGATGPLVTEVYKRLGAEVIELFCEPDGRFPNHLPDPTVVKYTRDLVAKVKETGADLGIGLDGDGDRIGVVDETGHLMWGDYLMILFARDVLRDHQGTTVVYDTKCSMALAEEIERAGGKPMIWKSGYPLIQSKMKEVGALLGGEMSGHIYLSDNYYGIDDGILAGCRVLQILSETDKTLSQVMSDAPVYASTPEMRADATEETKFEVVAKIAEHFRKEHETIDVDGVRVVFPDGWLLVRASNTQAVIVVRAEAKTEERLEEIKTMAREQLRKFPDVTIDF